MIDFMRIVNSRYLSMWKSDLIYLNSSLPIDKYFVSQKFKDIGFLMIVKEALFIHTDSGFVFLFNLNQKRDVFKYMIFTLMSFFAKNNVLFLVIGENKLINKVLKIANVTNQKKQIIELHKYKINQESITLNKILHLSHRLQDFEVLAFIPHRNDFDSLCLVVNHLLKNDIKIHIIDDFSDPTIIAKLKSTFSGNSKIEITFLPYSSFYNWTYILELIDELGAKSGADMIVRSDSDEYLYSSVDGLSLKEFLLCIESSNFKYVDATVVNLYSVNQSFTSPTDATHLSFGKEFSYQHVLRAWKGDKRLIGLSEYGGHYIPGKDQLYYPMSLILLHASLRSHEQARKKIEDRNLRGRLELDTKGWHSHYKDKSVDASLKVPLDSCENNSDFFKNCTLEYKYKFNLKFDQF